jgi:hypothetical protein
MNVRREASIVRQSPLNCNKKGQNYLTFFIDSYLKNDKLTPDDSRLTRSPARCEWRH